MVVGPMKLPRKKVAYDWMRQENQKDRVPGQTEQALHKSDLLHHPVSTTIAHYVENALSCIISLAAVLLIFPFSGQSILLEVCILLLAVWLSSMIVKSQRGATSSRFWIIVSVMLAVSTVCPFIVAPKPLYIAILDSANPFKSKIKQLESGGKVIGSVMLLSDSDFVRKSIIPIVQRLYHSRLRVLEKSHIDNNAYLSLPTLQQFTVGVQRPDEIIWNKSVFFPLSVPRHGVNMHLSHSNSPPRMSRSDTNELSFDVIGLKGCCLLNFAYTQFRDTVPWNTVRIADGDEEGIASYAALLDQAFGCFAAGNTEEALSILEGAITVGPNSNLEAARLATLQYLVTQMFFAGDVGSLQSLPLLHRAEKLFVQAKSDPHFSERDPLSVWLRKTLLGGYECWAWSGAFSNQVSELKSEVRADEDIKSYFDTFGDDLDRVSFADLRQGLETNRYSTADLHYIRYKAMIKYMTGWLRQFSVAMTNGPVLWIGDNDPNSAKFGSILSAQAKDVIPVIQKIDALLSQNGELAPDPHELQNLEFVRDNLPELFGTKGSEVMRLLELRSKESPDAMLYYSWVLVMENHVPDSLLIKGKDCEWWKTEYAIWFAHLCLDAIAGIHKHQHPEDTENLPGKDDVPELIQRYGIDSFTRDMGGKGRSFIPGIFCLAWYSQELGLPDREKLRMQFEKETLLPFDTYLSSLYSTNAANRQFGF